MLANFFHNLLQHVVSYIPLAINIVSRFLVVTIFFSGYLHAQEVKQPEVRSRVVSTIENTNSEIEQKAFELLNKERVLRGLSELKWNEDLAKLARLHSRNMATYKFFSHQGLDGMMVDARAESLGINKWRGIGENIAFCRGYENPVEFTVEQWMLSTSHKNNLLSKKWTESAVGIIITADETYYFTQVFMYK